MTLSKAPLHRTGIIALALALAAVSSCDEQPTTPAARIGGAALTPSLNLLPPPPPRPPAPGTLTGSISPGKSSGPLGPFPLGSFAKPTRVTVTTTSSVVQYHSSGTWIHIDQRGKEIGPRGPGAVYSFNLNACWNHPYYVSQWNPNYTAHCPGGSGALTMTKTSVMSGSVTAHWSGPANLCYGSPCHEYTGSYSVTIVPSPVTLKLAASANDVAVGEPVTFTASRSPTGAFTVAYWTWVADDPALEQWSPCGTANPCVIAPVTSGTMYVRALINGFHEQAEQYVHVGPLEVRIAGAGAPIKPQATGWKMKYSELPLSVSVFSSRGVAVPNRTVALGVAGKPNEGGHIHAGSTPTGTLAATSVSTGATGTAAVKYTASIFAGKVTVSGTSANATSATATINIELPGLTQLDSTATVMWIGRIMNAHPYSHWGEPGMVTQLQQMGAAMHAKYGIPLQVNDMSLQYGGKFDLSKTFTDGSHGEHRAGKSADIRTNHLNASQLKFLRYKWMHLGGATESDHTIHDETGTKSPHYHFRY